MKDFKIAGAGQRAVMRGTGEYSNIYNHWRRGRFYELNLLAYWQRLSAPEVYIDIGAHAGNHVVWAAKTWPQAHVFALEPNRPLFRILRKNIEANGLSNVEALRQAAWDSFGTYCLEPCGPDEGQYMVTTTPCDKGERILACPIDKTFQAKGQVIYVKIDTEGLVEPVLDGMRGTLSGNDCRLFIEGEEKELASVLRAHDYVLTGRKWGATLLYEAIKA
jgi:FkbM family methyltransferase